ncbi:AbrB/MazE/SpoVT family DNA-binding domain-containing protein [Bradyrhizobium diazoefficiens]|nr:AbrB/MazE/SpoVT family DNA-binding domain-containing protein [Bradyrhizobium diazoefficiens]QQN64664.1 AbrB/MazE/SpoVT family DNA-binding domain-containing protein [Bradyrhizobium diazoefficiens]
MITTLKIFRWDDDLAIALPQELVDKLAVREGDEIEIVEAVAPEDESKKPQD